MGARFEQAGTASEVRHIVLELADELIADFKLANLEPLRNLQLDPACARAWSLVPWTRRACTARP